MRFDACRLESGISERIYGIVVAVNIHILPSLPLRGPVLRSAQYL